jgi:hypothetical protein
VIHGDLLHSEPAAQPKGRHQGRLLFRVPPRFDQANIGELEGQQRGGHQARVVEPTGNRFCFRFPE